MSQLTYPTTTRALLPGTPQGEGRDYHGFNRREAMPAGVGVTDDTATNGVNAIRLPTLTGGVFRGVTHFVQNVDNQGQAGTIVFPIRSAVPVRRQGRIWVYVDANVLAGANVFVRHTANGGLNVLGAFRSDADTARADQVPNATFIIGGTAGGVALIELN